MQDKTNNHKKEQIATLMKEQIDIQKLIQQGTKNEKEENPNNNK